MKEIGSLLDKFEQINGAINTKSKKRLMKEQILVKTTKEKNL